MMEICVESIDFVCHCLSCFFVFYLNLLYNGFSYKNFHFASNDSIDENCLTISTNELKEFLEVLREKIC